MSDEPRSGCGCAVPAAVFIVGAVVGGFLGLLAGGIMATTRHYHDHFLSELSATEPALRADPEFKALRIEESSDGELYLHGTVPTHAAKNDYWTLSQGPLAKPALTRQCV